MTTLDTSAPATGRRLFYFPILHSRADLGGFEHQVTARAIEKMGRQQWEQQCRAIEQGWEHIEQVLATLDLCYPRCRIYQDGLPICGKELKIVTDLAQSGSHNHELLLSLCEKGATLMGTESLELLLEEYTLIKSYLSGEDVLEADQMTSKGGELLRRRDGFIAARINDTLEVGQTGLLFLGMLHSVQDSLSQDIQVIYPIVRPLLLSQD